MKLPGCNSSLLMVNNHKLRKLCKISEKQKNYPFRCDGHQKQHIMNVIYLIRIFTSTEKLGEGSEKIRLYFIWNSVRFPHRNGSIVNTAGILLRI